MIIESSHKTAFALFCLALPLVVLGVWTASLANIRATTETYRVIVTGYDPRDILQGQYIYLQYVWDDPRGDKIPGDTKKLPRTTKYFIPEYDGDDLDEMLRENVHVFSADVGVRGEKAQIKNLLIDERPWQEGLDAWRQNRQTPPNE